MERPEIIHSPNEILEAHDLLVSILRGEVKGLDLDDDEKAQMMAHANVLCWLLGHDHNRSFAIDLASLRREVERRGLAREEAIGMGL